MSKENTKKILLILFSIIVIIGIAFTIIYFKNKQQSTPNNDNIQDSKKDNDENVGSKIYKEPRYGFKYDVPDNFTYKDNDEYFFKVSSNENWYALVTIETMSMNNHKPVSEMEAELKLKIDPTKEKLFNEKYADIDVLGYQKLDEKIRDYYFVTPWDYFYRIIVFYDDDDFKFDSLKDIMYSLLTPDYD